MAGIQNDSGVSVIIGTLLLILITVTAAAGLAIMVSQMQKDEMNRQSHLAAVNNEKIMITGVTFKSNPADWDQFFPPVNATTGNATSNQSYSSVTFSITNLNTADSSVIGFSINDVYAHNFTVLADPTNPNNIPYNFSSQDPSSNLVVPGSAAKKIRINFTNDFFSVPPNIGPNDQVTIRLMTSLYNSFDRSFQPPTPVILFHTDTQNTGSISREVLVLDGSQSFAANNNTIFDWSWSIQDASNTTVSDPMGNCLDQPNLSPQIHKTGMILIYQPPTEGPFCVNLTLRDSSGMKKSSDYVLIPPSEQFVPPANFNALFNQTLSTINVTITDINGKGIPNQVVNYIFDNNPSGNLTLSNYVGETDPTGTASTIVLKNGGPGSGTVKVIYGNFQPFPVMVWNTT